MSTIQNRMRHAFQCAHLQKCRETGMRYGHSHIYNRFTMQHLASFVLPRSWLCHTHTHTHATLNMAGSIAYAHATTDLATQWVLLARTNRTAEDGVEEYWTGMHASGDTTEICVCWCNKMAPYNVLYMGNVVVDMCHEPFHQVSMFHVRAKLRHFVTSNCEVDNDSGTFTRIIISQWNVL